MRGGGQEQRAVRRVPADIGFGGLIQQGHRLLIGRLNVAGDGLDIRRHQAAHDQAAELVKYLGGAMGIKVVGKQFDLFHGRQGGNSGSETVGILL